MRSSFVIGLVFLMACDTPPPEEEPIDRILGVGDTGIFRGVDIGDSRNAVVALEAEHIVYNMPDELTCRIPLDLKDSTYYDITYNFNEGGVHVIELDIFPESDNVTRTLFNDFKAYYDLRFGESSVDDGFTMWTTRSYRGTAIEVSMIDESREAGRPYLTVNFYEHND
jgi:hypothetical protein